MVLAQDEGLFAQDGLDVLLQVEPSWANLVDKLAHGRLDGAVVLLALAMHLGLHALQAPGRWG